MILLDEELKQFYNLHCALMYFVNHQLNIISDVSGPDEFLALPPESRLEVRDALVERLELIDDFLDACSKNLSAEDIEIVDSWRHLVQGQFYAFRQLKNHMIFLSTESPATAYGVVALTDPFETVLPRPVPVMVRAVLMPFKDKIVYDGILFSYSISFGGGIKRSMNESYKTAKSRQGVVTSLPVGSTPLSVANTNQSDGIAAPRERAVKTNAKPATTTTKKTAHKSRSGKTDKVSSALNDIVALIDHFCEDHLNEEYAEKSRQLAEKLSRKRPSPLLRGKSKTWASGILRTIGWVNFLDDESFEPYMKLAEIDKAFGVASSTGQNKSSEIRKLMEISQLEPDWTVPSMVDDNPYMWLVAVNGLIVDMRTAPKHMQLSAFEQGLIPHLPGDSGVSTKSPTTKTPKSNEAKTTKWTGSVGTANGSPSDKIYQFKIALKDSNPVIWRRIQVLDCSLDKLHEHIQTSMGWTNSHLHDFTIDGQRYGDPRLLDDGFGDCEFENSISTKISDVLPRSGKRFQFRYNYDFGDSWEHDIVFEGNPESSPSSTLPLCIEGERACPPEDVGGVWGFREYLDALSDPTHENHEELLEWSGPFDPEYFDATDATNKMRRGTPAWY